MSEHEPPRYAPSWNDDPPAGTATGVGGAPEQPRSWYRKKRYLIPAGLVALFLAIGAVTGGDDPAPPTAAETTEAVETVSAEDAAAAEAAAAEERKAEESAA